LTAILLASDEFFQSAGGANEGFLKLVYNRLFGRDLDDSGRATWLGRLNGGESRQQIADLILQGDEWRGAEVKAYFRQILGREVDESGLASWKANVALLGEEAVIALLSASQEAMSKVVATA
jgi:hypothetical protein